LSSLRADTLQVESRIVQLKKEHPSWGAPKIREKLRRMELGVQTPAISTGHAVLDRHGLVTRRRRHRPRAQGTALSRRLQPSDLWCANYKGEFIDYPFHDHAHIVTRCGRICFGRRKINHSTVFAGQKVGVKEVGDRIWLVSFMHYDLG